MKDKIESTIEYYSIKSKELIDLVNSSNDLTVDQIIRYGDELSILENKITALEVAKEN
ncbi:MAG: hypothetical protein HKO92_10350 [Flavobacteriaceae bacterium]|nr:hypothetical protein [Bacteroidia bacterium]NNK83511.1 hypothetical protein [Flavobacteriaceae bacterium]